MLRANPSLGELIPRPADFSPDRQVIRGDYLYLIDEALGVCLRKPLVWDSPIPSGYYRLAKTSPAPQPTRRYGWYRPVRNGLMVTATLALIGLIYPLYPGLKYEVQVKLNQVLRASQASAAGGQELIVPPPTVSADNHLIIPKIGVTVPILEGPSLDILNHEVGVWHQTGILQTGNFVLAGHRWRLRPPNGSTFYNLDKLGVGDVIIIDWSHKRYVYVVNQEQTVPKTDVAVLDQTATPQITLYTCDDWNQTHRIVVTAKLQP